MPLRVKSRSVAQEPGLRTPSPFGRQVQVRFGSEPPNISIDDTFREVVKKLSVWVDTVPCHQLCPIADQCQAISPKP